MKFRCFFRIEALLVALQAGLLPYVSSAVDFSNVGKDFTTTANWSSAGQGYGMPNAEYYCDFTASGTYYAMNDFSVRQIGIKGTVNVTLDLTANNPVATLVMQQLSESPFNIVNDNSSLTVRSGVWNTGGGAAATLRAGVNARSSKAGTGRTLVFTDGAQVTNLWRVFQTGHDTATESDSNNRLVITGGAALFTTNFYGLFIDKTGVVFTNNVFEISDGGKLSALEDFYTDKRDAGTSWTVAGNEIAVLSGGKVVANGDNKVARIGNEAGDLLMRIADAGSTVTFNQMRMGYESTSRGNRLEVLDGGVLNVSDLYIGRYGMGNTLYVSNGTVNVSTLLTMALSSSSCSNTFHFAGSESVLSITTPQLNKNSAANNTDDGFDFFPNAVQRAGGGNAVIVSDNADLRFDFRIGLFRRSHDDTMRVTRGAMFGHTDTAISKDQLASIGRWDAASSNNTLYVDDGGTFRASYLRIAAVNNGLVVSNGTVTLSRNNASEVLEVGYSGTYTSPKGSVTNNHVILRGASPSIQAPNGPVALKNGSWMRFEVPAKGYTGTPIVSKTFTVDATSALSVTLDGYSDTSKTADYTLVETTGGVTLAAGVLDAANAALGDLGSLTISADGKKLMLHARGQSGITVIFR